MVRGNHKAFYNSIRFSLVSVDSPEVYLLARLVSPSLRVALPHSVFSLFSTEVPVTCEALLVPCVWWMWCVELHDTSSERIVNLC